MTDLIGKTGLTFKLSGKFAHFKKFFTNKSSLTYHVPTRTVLSGMIASVMEQERDSYYDWLSLENSKFGLKILNPAKTHFECLNYLSSKGGRTQVRFELLMGKSEMIEYQVYFFTDHEAKMKEFLERINNHNFGYGIYLGQRQFRGYIDDVQEIKIKELHQNEESEIYCLTHESNIQSIISEDINLINERMPIDFEEKIDKKKKNGRIPTRYDGIVFEEYGRKWKGKFKELAELDNGETISFYTPF